MRFHRDARDDLAIKGQCCTVSLWCFQRKVAVVVAAAEAEALTWPGVYYVRTWLNEGRCEVGDSLMYVLIGADIRPNCIDALQKLVGHIKNELVVEKEIFA